MYTNRPDEAKARAGSAQGRKGNGRHVGPSLGFITLVCLALLMTATVSMGQSDVPTLDWVRSTGGTSQAVDSGRTVATAGDGSVYVTGSFTGTQLGSLTGVDFDGPAINGQGGELTGLVPGELTYYLAHYDSTGNFLWVRSADGSPEMSGSGVATASDGSVYVTGYFAFDADFDGPGTTGQGGEVTDSGMFLAHYDSNGTLLWVQSTGGGYSAWGSAITVADDGNVYVTGHFHGTADFDGPGTNGQGGEVTSIGGRDIFLARYDSNGTLLWVRSAGGSSDNSGMAVATASDGSVYVTGHFKGTADFDGAGTNGQGGEVTSLSSHTEIFVARYNSNGALIWVRSAGGSSHDTGYGIDVAGGYVYVTGSFADTADFDGPGVNGQGGEVSAQWLQDIFVARYDSNGTLIWVRGAGGNGSDRGYSITAPTNGSVYLTGVIMGPTADFDGPGVNGQGGELSATDGDWSLFVARYNSFGSLIWVRNPDGGHSSGYGINIATDGSVYVAGNFSGSVDFDGPSATGLGGEVTSMSASDMFVVRYTQGPSIHKIPLPILVCWFCLRQPADLTTIYVRDIIERVIDVDGRRLPLSDVVIAGVSSDEPEFGSGDMTPRDIVIAEDCQSVQLATEAQPRGNGRVYTIELGVIGRKGNVATATHEVHMTGRKGVSAVGDSVDYTVEGCSLGREHEGG